MSRHFLSVFAVELTADEIPDLRRHLGLVDAASGGIGKRMAGPPLTKVLLVPFAEAIDKRQSSAH